MPRHRGLPTSPMRRESLARKKRRLCGSDSRVPSVARIRRPLPEKRDSAIEGRETKARGGLHADAADGEEVEDAQDEERLGHKAADTMKRRCGAHGDYCRVSPWGCLPSPSGVGPCGAPPPPTPGSLEAAAPTSAGAATLGAT